MKMIDIERNYRKKSGGISFFNHLFKKHSKRNLNEMVKCLSANSNESNDKLDHLLSNSLTNVSEMCIVNDHSEHADQSGSDILKEANLNSPNFREATTQLKSSQVNEETKRCRSTPIIVTNNVQEKKLHACKKLSLKTKRSFSPKSKSIINQAALNSKKKMSLDQELLEHYKQLSAECNSSYTSLASNAPISPRIKSIDEDIEALTLSRQDNPYIQNKLEKLSHYSGVNHDILSISNLSLHSNQNFVNSTSTLGNLYQSSHSNQLSQEANKNASTSSEELDEILNFSRSHKEDNLHQHLIRSPPPDFPLNFFSFICPPIGSPLRSLSTKYNYNLRNGSRETPNSIRALNLSSPLKRQSQVSNEPPKKDDSFFADLNGKKLRNMAESNENNSLTQENEVELIITS